MLRVNSFGAILLPTSKEYQSGLVSSPPSEISINTPLYIGGLPTSVNATHFNNRKLAFNGCIRRFEVASSFQYFSIDLTSPDFGGSSSGIGSCYINVEPGTYFNGSAWIKNGT